MTRKLQILDKSEQQLLNLNELFQIIEAGQKAISY